MPISPASDTLLDSLSTAIVTVNGQLEITYANDTAQSLLERSRNQLLQRKITDLFLADTLNVSRIQHAFNTTQDFSESEVQLALTGGRYLLADVTFSCIELAQGRNVLVEIRQVDQQKRITQENQQWAQQQAARHLIRGLAHEIKNPLGGIRGAAQLLEKELGNAQLQEFTQMIIEQSDRLRNLVDRLLGPNALPNFAWMNLHKAVENIRTLADADASHRFQIKRDYDPSIPDLYIDKDMIQQAVLNMVRNSVQAMAEANTEQGQIVIMTRVERKVTIQGKRYPLCAKIKIIDNGPGIPAELKDTLFYPMISSKQDGSGLGLSIAQTLIDHHRGKIDVESWPGHTEFIIYLPIDKKDA